jgi:hypothetical protein
MGWIADLLQEIPSTARYKVELEKLEYDYKVLKSENSDLRAKLKAAHLELNKLKQAGQKAPDSERSAIDTQILIHISRNAGINTTQLSSCLGMSRVSREALRFHLEELFNSNFVTFCESWDKDHEWTLRQEGRKYLIERNLLS